MILSGTHGLRVARRIVGLFVACALLPVAITIALSYARVQDALLAQRIGQLREVAADYSASVFERLSIADLLAQSLAEETMAGRTPDPKRRVANFFRAAAVVEGGERRVVFGSPSRLPDLTAVDPLEEQRAGDSFRLSVSADGNNGHRGLWLVRAVPAAEAARRHIAMELEPRYVWGAADDMPYQTDICVLDTHGEALYCTKPQPAAALAAFRARTTTESRGDLAWESGGTRYVGGYLELFLKARFGASAWTVVAIQPEEYALAPVQSVRRVVVPIVLLGLLIAALLGLVQVRRTLGPLKALTDATARIAARDFDARVPATRDDEFGALAAAFNSMSARLGRQFESLEANAEIDGVILSSVDISKISAIVLRRVAQVMPAGRCILLLADPAHQGAYRVHTAEDPGGLAGCLVTLTESEIGRLTAATGGLSLTDSGEASVTALAVMGLRNACTLPIFLANELAGVVVVGHDEGRPPDTDDIAQLRELADRVAVALATAQRDQELHRRAHYDALTQLPNRRLGMEELTRAVAAARRHDRPLAVLFVDLDEFSAVNDSLGHAAGDQVLVHAAARLRECVRKSDIVARLGGDEFALVLPEIREAQDAALAATHMIEALSRPFRVDREDAFVSASVGIALYPGDGANAEELLRHADLAMYQAKQKGRRRLAFFEPSMNADVQRRLTLHHELRQALEQEQFTLYYQPQLDVASGRIFGAEALIRWNHPVRGLVPPVQFIGFAESSVLIEDIGRWALRAACRQFMEWRTDGLPLEHVSVNVAPRQFGNPELTGTVAEALRESEMAAAALRLEITESAVIDNEGPVAANLADLNKLGVRLELDDFGTGYSSLAYLQRLPVATVKLDRALVRTIETDESHRAVVRAAIDMVHALGKTVVAEGVETAGQLAILGRLGCNAIQGYHLSPPLPAAAFVKFVRKHAAGARTAA